MKFSIELTLLSGDFNSATNIVKKPSSSFPAEKKQELYS